MLAARRIIEAASAAREGAGGCAFAPGRDVAQRRKQCVIGGVTTGREARVWRGGERAVTLDWSPFTVALDGDLPSGCAGSERFAGGVSQVFEMTRLMEGGSVDHVGAKL